MNSVFWSSLKNEDFKFSESPAVEWILKECGKETASKFWLFFCKNQIGGNPKPPRKLVKKFLCSVDDMTIKQIVKDVKIYTERTIYRMLNEKK